MFSTSKEGYKSTPAKRHRLEGFMQAGVFMEMTTNAELSDLMEKVHQEVFGKSIKERQEESHSRKDEVLDYSQYDQPTYERKR